MTAIARMAMLDLRTVAPYSSQGLLIFGAEILLFANKPTVLLPVLVLLFTSTLTANPFNIADKANLETLYAVLPLSRRSVVFGHYAWALACFLATATVGAPLAVLFARAQHVPFDGRTLVTVLTLSWALFALNVAIQFPLLIRLGYSRTNYLASVLPSVVVVGVVYRMHLNVPSVRSWLPLILWVAGAVAIVASAAVTLAVDRKRVRYRPPAHDDRPGRQQSADR
ncbi:ABC-2 transporter permease [Rugosimonospora africana]|uniref:Uncharacterized protein n=1 Tax=Rugosimonospora africana TaxID=556532 RepID=A0A8J3QWM9_9ACTN|nr:ABC-2 transporter permease [Rugosimonospora africana]GIH18499.1 hypothetical protein Raf01_66710 [Rugosimonospora africana]